MIRDCSRMNEGAHLSEDSRELSLVGIGWRSYDMVKRDGHILKYDVETIISCESLQGCDNVTVPNLSERVECLLGRWLGECSHVNKSNRRRLPKRYLNGTAKVKLIALVVPLPWRLPSSSKLEGVYRRRYVRLPFRLVCLVRSFYGILSWRAASFLIRSVALEGPAGSAWALQFSTLRGRRERLSPCQREHIDLCVTMVGWTHPGCTDR